MQIIIDTADTSITVKNKCFFIENRTVSRQVSPKRISSIAITSNCTLNSSAIKLAANHQVPILFFNNFGTIQARLWSPYFVNIADLRKKQLIFSMSDLATSWVIGILEKKTEEQIINLGQLVRQRPALKEKVEIIVEKIKAIALKLKNYKNQKLSDVRNQLMGLEGNISHQYFQTLNLFLPKPFHFEKRSRRPALDYFNAGLNYLYGMTYSIVESAVFAKGLDPFIGCLHADSFKKPTLVFDLIEPMRPVVDRMLLNIIITEQLKPEYFTKKAQGYWINKEGKRIIISSFNEFLHQRVSLNNSVKRIKDHIFEESNALGNLIGESIHIT